MSLVRGLAERIRQGGSAPLPVSTILGMASMGVRLGMWRRRRLPRVRVDARVISFGNLTAGGSGKTPAVIERAQQEIAAGRKVAVLSRGYRRASKAPAIAVGGANRTIDWRELGDEPALMARKLDGVLILVDPGRIESAQRAIAEYGCDTLILDDGFQYVQLERDEDAVVIDATNPFGNGYLLPRGILREPIDALARATHIVLTHCDRVHDSELEALETRIRDHCPEAPVRRTRHAPVKLWRLSDGSDAGLGMLHGAEVDAVCAIANPESFHATLEALGASVMHRTAYPDHRPIPSKAFLSHRPVITTEKDAVRLSGMDGPPNGTDGLGPLPENAYALEIALQAM